MKSKFLFLSFLAMPIILTSRVSAHCPLCTAGAAAAAGGAIWFGVNNIVVSILIGAFAVSMGWWFSRMIKKQYIPLQRTVIILLSFGLTIIPILPIIGSQDPYFISMMGEYGTLLNRTYVIDMGLVGSFIGGLIMIISPGVSQKITKLRKGKHISYQRMIVTFSLLAIAAILAQLLL